MSFSVSHGNGIAVKYKDQTILLDPNFSDFTSIVSHAHSDHCPEEIIKKPYCTEETAEFANIRNPNFHSHTLKEGKGMKFDGFSVKLISAGHILGSIQTMIEADGKSILYTGDFKVRENLTCKKIDIQHADVLITEATYGYPAYQIPDSELVRKQFVKWIEENLKKNKKINVGAYSLGKAQEAIKILNDAKIVPQVSDMVRKFSDSYKKFGVKLEFLGKDEGGEVFIKPMHVIPQTTSDFENCVLTGWAMSRDYGCQGFALSDHADFNELMEFIKEVNPKKVYCVHGNENGLAKEIRKRLKINATTLTPRQQKVLTDF